MIKEQRETRLISPDKTPSRFQRARAGWRNLLQTPVKGPRLSTIGMQRQHQSLGIGEGNSPRTTQGLRNGQPPRPALQGAGAGAGPDPRLIQVHCNPADAAVEVAATRLSKSIQMRRSAQSARSEPLVSVSAAGLFRCTRCSSCAQHSRDTDRACADSGRGKIVTSFTSAEAAISRANTVISEWREERRCSSQDASFRAGPS